MKKQNNLEDNFIIKYFIFKIESKSNLKKTFGKSNSIFLLLNY